MDSTAQGTASPHDHYLLEKLDDLPIPPTHRYVAVSQYFSHEAIREAKDISVTKKLLQILTYWYRASLHKHDIFLEDIFGLRTFCPLNRSCH